MPAAHAHDFYDQKCLIDLVAMKGGCVFIGQNIECSVGPEYVLTVKEICIIGYLFEPSINLTYEQHGRRRSFHLI